MVENEQSTDLEASARLPLWETSTIAAKASVSVLPWLRFPSTENPG